MTLTDKLRSLVSPHPVNRLKEYVELEEVLKVLEPLNIKLAEWPVFKVTGHEEYEAAKTCIDTP